MLELCDGFALLAGYRIDIRDGAGLFLMTRMIELLEMLRLLSRRRDVGRIDMLDGAGEHAREVELLFLSHRLLKLFLQHRLTGLFIDPDISRDVCGDDEIGL